MTYLHGVTRFHGPVGSVTPCRSFAVRLRPETQVTVVYTTIAAPNTRQ